MHSGSARLQRFLSDRYPATSAQRLAVRPYVGNVCQRFIASGVADTDFENELCSGIESRFWQRFTEAALTCDVLDAGLTIAPARSGPDLCIEHIGRKIWVEFICPEPVGIPSEWLDHESGVRPEFPYQQMLLRWTSAIKEKSEKLLGGQRSCGYLKKGIVSPDDSYVIAVNGRQLRGTSASLYGLSQFPFAVEAAFAVGPYQFNIDKESLTVVGSNYQHRPYIKRTLGEDVSAYTFLDERYVAVSAIWATDFDDCSGLGNQKALAVVHNPLATNPLPVKFLPSWEEYVATPDPNDGYFLCKQHGRLGPQRIV